MSAGRVGQDLLSEVQEETLEQLLFSLRENGHSDLEAFDWLGVPCLDRISSVFNGQKDDSPCPPVIDITSIAPASGKTHILYLLVIAALLPVPSDGFKASKPAGAVVIFDTDGRFNVERLAELIYYRLRSTVNAAAENSEKFYVDSVRNALKHVHIFRPQSLGYLVSTVHDLPMYLFNTHENFSGDRALDLVVIDSISAFYWQDKSSEESASIEADAEQPRTLSSAYEELTKGLRQLQHSFSCSVAVTSWGLSPFQPRSGQALSLRPLLPAAWQSFCSVRLVVERDAVKKFPPCMSIEQAKLDAEARQAVVNQGQFTARVDRWGSDGWQDEVWKAFNSSPENRSFSFRISSEGVDIVRGKS